MFLIPVRAAARFWAWSMMMMTGFLFSSGMVLKNNRFAWPEKKGIGLGIFDHRLDEISYCVARLRAR